MTTKYSPGPSISIGRPAHVQFGKTGRTYCGRLLGSGLALTERDDPRKCLVCAKSIRRERRS